MLFFWLYISRAKVPPRSADDGLIYLQARKNNAAFNISGYLHRENGYYVQYVEGPKNALEQLKFIIRWDWRHDSIRTLAEGRISTRRFSEWDMAFSDEETSSFRVRQIEFGGETDIGKSSMDDILQFMNETALNGKVRSIADVAYGQNLLHANNARDSSIVRRPYA